jgi:hypothetical protein
MRLSFKITQPIDIPESTIQFLRGYRQSAIALETGGALARIFHKGIEQRSGEGVRRLDITKPNESTTHRFFYYRL